MIFPLARAMQPASSKPRDEAPAGEADCRCGGVTTRLKHTLRLPPGRAGEKLWVMAQWLSPTGAGGPISAPASAIIAA